MDKETKSLLAEFTQKSLQRLESKKRPRYQTLHIPSLDVDIKIRSITMAEYAECQNAAKNSEDEDRGDKNCVYLAVVEPCLKDVANEIMVQESGLPADQKQIHEPLDIVNIFESYEITEIAMHILYLSGIIGKQKITTVEESKQKAAEKAVDALKN